MPASGGVNRAGVIKCGGGKSKSKGMPGTPNPSSIPGGGGGMGDERRGGCSIIVFNSSLLVTPSLKTGPEKLMKYNQK